MLCANPAALALTMSTAGAPLTPYFISRSLFVGAHWVTYPGLYTGTCESKGGAPPGLRSTARPGRADRWSNPRSVPRWGLHTDDVNLALGNLVDDVQAAEATYAAQHPTS